MLSKFSKSPNEQNWSENEFPPIFDRNPCIISNPLRLPIAEPSNNLALFDQKLVSLGKLGNFTNTIFFMNTVQLRTAFLHQKHICMYLLIGMPKMQEFCPTFLKMKYYLFLKTSLLWNCQLLNLPQICCNRIVYNILLFHIKKVANIVFTFIFIFQPEGS